jgi:hypothetical protein
MALLAILFALIATLAGCTGQVVNTAPVYQPVTGVIQMEITVPAGESVTSVRFLVDEQLVSEDDDASDGFSAELDTSELEPDSLVRIKAVGVRANKTTVTLRENYILIGNPDAEVAPETEATAAG